MTDLAIIGLAFAVGLGCAMLYAAWRTSQYAVSNAEEAHLVQQTKHTMFATAVLCGIAAVGWVTGVNAVGLTALILAVVAGACLLVLGARWSA